MWQDFAQSHMTSQGSWADEPRGSVPRHETPRVWSALSGQPSVLATKADEMAQGSRGVQRVWAPGA